MNDEELLEHYRKRFNLAVKVGMMIDVRSDKFRRFCILVQYYRETILEHRFMTGAGSPKTQSIIGIPTNSTYEDLLNQINDEKKTS